MSLARTLRTAALGVAAASLLVFGGTAPAQAAPPPAPTRVIALPQENPIDANQPLIRLRWTPPKNAADITGYRVYVDGSLLETVRVRACPPLTSVPPVAWCANVTNLVIGQTYTFGISSLSRSGES